jgi:hypothetical protein
MATDRSDAEFEAALRKIMRILDKTLTEAKAGSSSEIEERATKATQRIGAALQRLNPRLQPGVLLFLSQNLLSRVLHYVVGTRPSHRRN